MAEQMELIIIEEKGGEQFLTVAGVHMKAVEVYTGPEGVEKIIADIEAEVAKFTPDTTTAKGRAAIASMSHRVSKSKVVLFNLGKTLTADWKAKAKKVDEAKATVEKRMDELRDKTRQPLTEWEEAEEKRLAAEKLAKEIEDAHTAALTEHALFLKAKELEVREAELARIEAERVAREEAEKAAQAAKEAAEQAEIERAMNEARIRREAEEKAKKEAEEAAAAAIAEAERKEREATEAAEKAERERIAAEKKAEEEKAAAIIKAREDQERAVKEAEERARVAAEAKEFARQVAESKAAAQAEFARREAESKAADVEHRRAVNKEALKGLTTAGLNDEQAKAVITAIIGGLVPHVSIQY